MAGFSFSGVLGNVEGGLRPFRGVVGCFCPLVCGGGGVVAPARADFSLVFSSGGCGFSYHFASGAFPFRLGLGRWLHGVDSTVLFPV